MSSLGIIDVGVEDRHGLHEALEREAQVGEASLPEASEADDGDEELDNAEDMSDPGVERVKQLLVVSINAVCLIIIAADDNLAKPGTALQKDLTYPVGCEQGEQNYGTQAQQLEREVISFPRALSLHDALE